jgi:hypothetical protein
MKEWTPKEPLLESVRGKSGFLNDFAETSTRAERTRESLLVRLEGRPKFTEWWKDWIVLRLLEDLQGQFDELIAVEAFVNCSE